MVAEVFGGVGAFKAMMDIAKSMKDMDAAAQRNAAVIELQEKIFAAHTAQTSLIERVAELEAEVAGFKTWEAEKKRYELQSLSRGFVAYVLKTPERSAAPAHAICTNCYEKGFKSILQSNGKENVFMHAWNCPSCQTSFACQSKDMGQMIARLDG